MTKVEIHVFDPGIAQCSKDYVCELVRSRTRYCRVCLCVDTREEVEHWQAVLSDVNDVEVFDREAQVPTLPFQGEMLVSLSSQVSPVFSAFKQTIDLVTDSESARESGRVRYRFYRDRGYPLRHIKVQEMEPTT